MTYLLGGGAIAGVLAMVATLTFIIHLSRKNRDDMIRLLTTTHELDELRLQKERADKAIEARDAVIQNLQNALANEKGGREIAEAQVASVLKELGREGNPAGAGERIRRSLRLLEQMSPVPGEAGGDRDSGAPLYGAPASRTIPSHPRDELSGSERRKT
jgi:hypothetical protein